MSELSEVVKPMRILLLVLLGVDVKGQSSMEPVPTYITHHSWEPSVAITVGAIIFALLCMALISVYLRRCGESRIIIHATTLPCSCSQQQGISAELLNTFPTLVFSNINTHLDNNNNNNKGLECAVCLTDFTDGDTLRLLPKCSHVFHPRCIDSWLASNVTCPVCRANLTLDASSHLALTLPPAQDPPPQDNPDSATHKVTRTQEINQGSLRVQATDPAPSPTSADNAAETAHISGEMSSGARPETMRELLRSNSTGHSLVERYTLRLPEDVRRYILLNHAQRSASVKGGMCSSDGEEGYAGKKWVICTPPFVAAPRGG
ncbi:hypothetical protein Fmac_015870 [Flemingia macrophylla]|uniref:RING-type E3 ubiquitin transferase n=1 Tax=Flemingia macrophylla TaxID=520843 RepID=A0ABD1MFV7_9FABA